MRNTMYCFQVADIFLRVQWDNEDEKLRKYRYHDCLIMPRVLEAFRTEAGGVEPDINITVGMTGKYVYDGKCKKIHNQSFYQRDGKMILTIYDPFNVDLPGYSIEMSADYCNAAYIPHINEFEHFDLQWVMFPFEGKVLYKGGIVLHGAAIEYDRKGIIFTGTSGAGKSTQAHLWQKYREALIINGDCPVVKIMDGIPKVFGSPWCGTSGEAINRSVPLSAVVLVKKGQKDSIRELKGNEAFLAVLANVLHSNFDRNSLDLAIANLQNIIGRIRVFEMICTISEKAVETLEGEIMEVRIT
jgi:hypothetical protein